MHPVRFAVVAALIAGSVLGCGDTPDSGGESGVVVEVVDGDTIDVAGVGRIRLIGIDTPEVGECGYQPATDRLESLVQGREVDLVPGGADDVDRYDRLLRYVDVDGVDAGLMLLEEGYAIARYDSRDGYGAHDREEAYIAADDQVPGIAGCGSR